MAQFAEVARPTVYKLVAELRADGVLTLTRSVGDSKFYRLNLENPRIVSMLQVDFEAITKELATGMYDEKPRATTEHKKTSAGGRARGRLALRGRMGRARTDQRQAAQDKNSKSSN